MEISDKAIQSNVTENRGHIINIGTNYGTIIINDTDMKKIKETTLFLRIEKDLKNNYNLMLELKSSHIQQGLVKEHSIVIGKGFFDILRDFEQLKQNRENTRELNSRYLITEQVKLEKAIGIKIYNTFFIGEIRKYFEYFFELLTKRKIERLSLIISSNVPEILNIPFEMMKNNLNELPFSVFNDAFLIARTAEKNFDAFEVSGIESSNPPLKILFVTSLPHNMPEEARFLELEKEQEELIEVLGDLEVLVDFLEIASLKEIENAVAKGSHHILHISGHGSYGEDKGILYLEDEDGETEEVTGRQLADVLKKYVSLRMVIISACETARAEDFGVAGALMEKGLPVVLAMRYPITDNAARIFTTQLYKDICRGNSICKSLFNARNCVMQYENEMAKKESVGGKAALRYVEWYTPFLYINQSMDVLVDYKKSKTDIENFYYRKQNILSEGKWVGHEFIGRHKEIVRLTKAFREKKNTVCIYGQGGVGKTTLAERFAENYENGEFSIIKFTGKITENQIITEIANRVKDLLDQKKAKDTPTVKNMITGIVNSQDKTPIEKLKILVKNFLYLYKIIILFDNFEDNQSKAKTNSVVHGTEITSNSLRKFLECFCSILPKSDYILFTTRYKFSNFSVSAQNYNMNLTEMNFPDTYKLMSRFRWLSTLKLKEKREVYNRIGGHPRALELLESYLTSQGLNWHDISKTLLDIEDKEINHDLLLDMLWRKVSKDDRKGMISQHIISLFFKSKPKIQKLSYRKVLQYACVFRSQTPIKFLLDSFDLQEDKLNNAIEYLNNLSLLYIEDDKFYVHRLNSTFILTQKTRRKEYKKLHMQAAGGYLTKVGDGEIENNIGELLEARWHYIQAQQYGAARRITEHLVSFFNMNGYLDLSIELLAELAGFRTNGECLALIFNSLGMTYHDKCSYDEALECYVITLKISLKIRDVHMLGESCFRIGVIHHDRNQYDKALEYYNKSLEIFKEINNLDWIASATGQIGKLYNNQYDYENALKYLNDAVEMLEKVDNDYEKSTAYIILGDIWGFKCNYDKAMEYYQKGLEICEKVGDVKRIIMCYRSMGIVLQYKGDYDRAMDYFEKTLEISKNVESNYRKVRTVYGYSMNETELREKSYDIVGVRDSYFRIGMIHQYKGELDKALDYYYNALELYKERNDTNGIASIYQQIGLAYQHRSEFDKALEYYQKSLEAATEIDDKLGIANGYHQIGSLYQSKSEYAEALEYYKKGLDIFFNIDDKLGIRNSYHQIGMVCQYKANYTEALEYYDKALKMSIEIGDKLGIANGYHQIGSLYQSKSEYAEASEYYKNGLDIFVKMGDRVGIRNSYHQIGIICQYKAKYTEALEYYKKALEISTDIGDRQGEANSYHLIGIISRYQNNYEEMFDYYNKALDIYKAIDDKVGILNSYYQMGIGYQRNNNYEKASDFYNRALKICEEIDYITGIGYVYLQIGTILRNNFDEALNYYNKALELFKQVENTHQIGNSYFEIGKLYYDKVEYSQTLYFVGQAYKIFLRIGVAEEKEAKAQLLDVKQRMQTDEFNSVFPRCGLNLDI